MMKQLLVSVKFLYEEVLNESVDFDFNIKMKKPSRIPVVLSVQEVDRFLNSFTNLKHKAIFTMIYSAGLRIGELLNLKIRNIDSDRMQIRIHQEKGQKDRYSILSEKVLTLLRDYVNEYQPKEYLFEGQSGGKYSSSSIQTLMRKHKKLCKINKKATPILSGIALPPTYSIMEQIQDSFRSYWDTNIYQQHKFTHMYLLEL